MFSPEDEQEIKKRLSDITNDVKLILFTQTLNCDTCVETEGLMRALCVLSEKLKLEILNPYLDRERAEQYKVERVPALILEGDRDYGIRYFGAPGGYEFASLLEDIVAIGKRESGLSEASKDKIRALAEPIHLKVFVTPT